MNGFSVQTTRAGGMRMNELSSHIYKLQEAGDNRDTTKHQSSEITASWAFEGVTQSLEEV